MSSRSLLRRAIALVLLAELLCAIAFSLTAVWQEHRTRLRAFDVMLQGRADSLLGAIQDAEDPDDNVTVDPTELRLPHDDVYAVYNKGGRLLGTSPDAPTALVQTGTAGIRQVRVGHRTYRVLQFDGVRVIDRAEYNGVGLRRPVTLIYAVPVAPLWHQIFGAVRFSILISTVLIGSTALLLVVLLRRLLWPLRDLAAAAAAVDSSRAAFAPPPTALAVDELRPLAEALSATIERLRQALEAQHRFVSDAAHELKTAVAIERSALQLLTLRERTPQEYALGLEQVLEDNDRTHQLVQRMLQLGRLEEDPAHVAGTCDLGAVVEDALAQLRGWSESRGVTLEVRAESHCRVALNHEAAGMLLTNLVRNAVQHSPQGSTVTVLLSAAEGVATLQVVDSGDGIAPEHLPHLFQRFYRADRSRSRDTGGFGLGLAICRSVVEGAGGAITLASQLGSGTTVTARLPLSA
ncbi:MAG: HAMP domain-containing histidine kinase [Acidobacteriota bacterium]|nr:HAMP domain-containing histidine kinase [Acidobacteriota bacterium]